MTKKNIRLTEGELVMNEIDAATYARVHRAISKAQAENQKGNYIHQVNPKKSETNDSIITRGIELESRAADSMIAPYKDIQFMFYSKNLRQNVAITLFKLERLFELTSDKAVLKGNIVFNNQLMNGSIIINIDNGATIFYHSSSKKKYPLEIDNRFADQWNKLVSTLQQASKLINA